MARGSVQSRGRRFVTVYNILSPCVFPSERKVCQIERLFNVLPLEDIWMCSWPGSRQEAVYRPAVRDELCDEEMALWLCVMYTNTHTH